MDEAPGEDIDPGPVPRGGSRCLVDSWILDAFPVGVVIHAGGGQVIRCNVAAEQVLGLSESQMLGLSPTEPCWRAVHEDGTAFPGETHPAMVTLRTGDPVVDVVMGVHKPDGTLTWISVNATPIAIDPDVSEPAVLATFADISEQVRLRNAARESEARYRLLAENMTDVVIHIRDDVIVWVSPSVQDSLGWLPEEWVGACNTEFVHPDDADGLRHKIATLKKGETLKYRVRFRARDGVYHWFEGRGRTFLSDSGQPDGRISTIRDIDTEVAAQVALREKAIRDDLTGLLTRGEILDRLATILSHPPRGAGQIAVAFCDLDDFKLINDRYGHGAGDETLRTLAVRIGATVRENDLISRFGGDEILVVLDAVRDEGAARAVAEKIRVAAQLPIPFPGGAFTVTLSIGIALTAPGETLDTVIARADAAMYDAKAGGKNQVVVIDSRSS